MKHPQLYRGVLAIVIGALALWKGVAAADVTPIDRSEAVTVRGESDAVLGFIPLPQVVPMKSCVSNPAKTPCNEQQGISNVCNGTCPNGDMCIMADNTACYFCKTSIKARVKDCVQSAAFKCYSGVGATVTCGKKFVGTKCASFATTCITGSTCFHTCKETKQQMGDCPDIKDSCTGNAN